MRIYVASPYSHINLAVQEERYLDVMDYVARLIREGKHAFSPIVYGHEMAKYHKLPTDALFWEEFNHGFLLLCDIVHVYCLDGWETSKGVTAEIKFAQEHSIPVVSVVPYPR